MLSIDLKNEAYMMTKNCLRFNRLDKDEIIDFVFETLKDAMVEDFGIVDFEEFTDEECLRISQGIDTALNESAP